LQFTGRRPRILYPRRSASHFAGRFSEIIVRPGRLNTGRLS